MLFRSNLYRTDYAASIAIHLLCGQVKNSFVQQLPGKLMRYSDQIDELINVNNINDYTFLCPQPDTPWELNCSRIKNENIHIMNKLSIMRHENKLMELLS